MAPVAAPAAAPKGAPAAAVAASRNADSGDDSGSGSGSGEDEDEAEVEAEAEEWQGEGAAEALEDLLDPLWHVRDSASFVAARASHVTLDRAAVRAVAATWAESGLGETPPVFDRALHFVDESRPRLTAQYFFVLDALNFCFWPDADGEPPSQSKAKQSVRRVLRLLTARPLSK